MAVAKKAPTRAAKKRAAAFRRLDATRLLEADHADVRQLFAQYQQLVDEVAGGHDRQALAERICTMLIVHATIEEEIFYPAARDVSNEHDLLDEAEVEHGLARVLVEQILEMGPEEALYDARVKVLGQYVEHHVRQEEGELFPRCRTVGMDLQALGAELAERKQMLLAEATGAARDMLAQVVAAGKSVLQRGRH